MKIKLLAEIFIIFFLIGNFSYAEKIKIWQPKPGTSWQWQLNGELNTEYDVKMYDIDLFDTSKEAISKLKDQGRIVICYFSAGTSEDWREDFTQYPKEIIGEKLDEWDGENWLDIRNKRLRKIISDRMDMALYKGCDGIEPDNVDGYNNNSGFDISEKDQVKFNIWLAETAHKKGLSIGLKNAVQLIPKLEKYYDWALNEQCFEFDECEEYKRFIKSGKAVFGVEYNLEKDEFCEQANIMNFDWLIMELDLNGTRQSCR